MLLFLWCKHFIKELLVPVHSAGNINVIHEAVYVQGQIRGVGTHQFLQFPTFLVQTQQSSRIVLHIELVLALKLFTEVIHQRLVKVTASEVGIERCGQDLSDIRESNNADILWWKMCLSKNKNQIPTLSFPLLKAVIETWNDECPMSTNTTFLGRSSGVGRSCL